MKLGKYKGVYICVCFLIAIVVENNPSYNTDIPITST